MIVGRVKEILGEPRNYGLSPEERADAARRQQQEEVTNTLTLYTDPTH